jgi:hypothetical protein
MFKIGQKVVCKAENPQKTIKNGRIYTVTEIDYDGAIRVKEAEPSYPYSWFWQWRFEPIKYEIISNKEIIKEIITEKSDLPIKEPVLN